MLSKLGYLKFAFAKIPFKINTTYNNQKECIPALTLKIIPPSINNKPQEAN